MSPYYPNRTTQSREVEKIYNENVKCTDNKLITIMIDDDLYKRCYKHLDESSFRKLQIKLSNAGVCRVKTEMQFACTEGSYRTTFDNVFYL